MSIRLVCFDLGRVLVRICDTWAHACELAGVPVPRMPLPDDVLRQVRQLVHAHEIGQLTHEQFCQQMAPHLGITPQQVDRMMHGFLLNVYPGALELLAELKSAGYKTACLSNTNETHWQNMCDPNHPAWLPFENFDYAFGSQEIGLRKPSDEIYRHVESTTGFRGDQILFFDDIEENVQAARNSRWHAEVIARDHEPIRQIREHLKRHGVLTNADKVNLRPEDQASR
jgi:putative hydrolase of the HAD superfamily